jgi:hypothetical protein
MNCREAQERLVELFDLDAARGGDLERHLAACDRCAADYAALRSAVQAIDSPPRVHASPDFKERVMRKLTEVEPAPRRWRFMPRLALVGAAAIVALVLFMPRSESPAMSLMAQSAEAMSNLQTVHITARMRTLPHDNFELIDLKYDWVPLEIWKQFGATAKWRVQKPGRIAVMDGTSSMMLIGADHAVRGGPRPGFLDWVNGLLETGSILDHELAAARAGQTSARLAEQEGHYVLAVERPAQGDFKNDWLLNKGVATSNHKRVYRFDAASKRLESMQLALHTPSGDEPVFEITSIRYNEALPASLFALELPGNVTWDVDPEQMPARVSLPQSAKEAAAMFFDGLSRQDWDTLAAVVPYSAPPKWMPQVAGVEVISLGEPFQSGNYPGWFVPYEIRMNGHSKKHNLAVRNDNPTHRWVFDGGF